MNPIDGDTRQKSMDGDGALYLATYGVLNSSQPDTGLLVDLIKAGLCENIRYLSFCLILILFGPLKRFLSF